MPSDWNRGLPWHDAGCCGGFPCIGAPSIAHAAGRFPDAAATLCPALGSEPDVATQLAIANPVTPRAPKARNHFFVLLGIGRVLRAWLRLSLSCFLVLMTFS